MVQEGTLLAKDTNPCPLVLGNTKSTQIKLHFFSFFSFLNPVLRDEIIDSVAKMCFCVSWLCCPMLNMRYRRLYEDLDEAQVNIYSKALFI